MLVTVKVAVVAPDATVTVAGTVAAAVLLLDRVTVLSAPLPPAGAFRVTVAVEFRTPPTTVVGFRVIDATCGGLTVKLAVLVTPLSFAVRVPVAVAPREEVVTVKFALVEPAGTVTLAGSLTPLMLSDKATTAPPVTAGLSNVTVPVVEFCRSPSPDSRSR